MSFPFFLAQTGGECLDGFVDELHACGRWRSRRIVCEDIVLDAGIEGRPGHAFLLIVERHIVGLAAPQDGVDRFIERTHAVVALGTRALEPVDGAVGPGNEAVGASGDVDDDFAFVDHSSAATQS